jgi:hypothetical protein
VPEEHRHLQFESVTHAFDVIGHDIATVGALRRLGPAVASRVDHDDVIVGLERLGHGRPATAVVGIAVQ